MIILLLFTFEEYKNMNELLIVILLFEKKKEVSAVCLHNKMYTVSYCIHAHLSSHIITRGVNR